MFWLVSMADYERTKDRNSDLEITTWNYWLGNVEISTSEGNTFELAAGMLKFFKYSFSHRCSDLFLPSIPRGRFQAKKILRVKSLLFRRIYRCTDRENKQRFNLTVSATKHVIFDIRKIIAFN